MIIKMKINQYGIYNQKLQKKINKIKTKSMKQIGILIKMKIIIIRKINKMKKK